MLASVIALGLSRPVVPLPPVRMRSAVLMSAFDPASVRAISLDVTGTIITYTEPVVATCAAAEPQRSAGCGRTPPIAPRLAHAREQVRECRRLGATAGPSHGGRAQARLQAGFPRGVPGETRLRGRRPLPLGKGLVALGRAARAGAHRTPGTYICNIILYIYIYIYISIYPYIYIYINR